jgi:hypothetical protein
MNGIHSHFHVSDNSYRGRLVQCICHEIVDIAARAEQINPGEETRDIVLDELNSIMHGGLQTLVTPHRSMRIGTQLTDS